jgi:DNA-binding response OmpR family regulator
MSKHILIVDDDILLRRSLAFSLEKGGYTASTAGSAEDALNMIQNSPPDLILLDIGLPGGIDGLEALHLFQREKSTPIIFVTARRRELDEVVGLELGADDYITKPFDNDVLLAHIRAVLRRWENSSSEVSSQSISVGDLRIEIASHEVFVRDRLIELSPREFDILTLLSHHSNQVISVEDILDHVWGEKWVGETQTVYVHIRWLREKIESDPAHPRRLITMKGVGYKLIALNDLEDE